MLTTRDGHEYGDGADDVLIYLESYASVYPVHRSSVPVCECGGATFRLLADDIEGAAVRRCTDCQHEHTIGDSARYLVGAELEQCECPCGDDRFQLVVGVSHYPGSTDVRWAYLGARCSECSLVGCYADWKSESGDSTTYLDNA